MLTREEYENLINNSPLFEIDKESSPALYKTERYNLLTLIADYYRHYVYPNKPLEKYSLTLMETAVECIKYYKSEKGVFLHLLNNSLKRELRIAYAKEEIEKVRRGIQVSKENDKLIRKIIAYANSKGLDVGELAVQKKIADALGLPLQSVQEMLLINSNAVAVSNTVTNEEGDEVELVNLQASHEKNAEDKVVGESAFISLVEKINNVFATIQDRQKRLLSMLLTAEIIKACDEDVDKACKVLAGKEMFNKEVLDYYNKHGKLPTAKHIGSVCKVSEQSLSRTFKNFKEKLKDEQRIESKV